MLIVIPDASQFLKPWMPTSLIHLNTKKKPFPSPSVSFLLPPPTLLPICSFYSLIFHWQCIVYDQDHFGWAVYALETTEVYSVSRCSLVARGVCTCLCGILSKSWEGPLPARHSSSTTGCSLKTEFWSPSLIPRLWSMIKCTVHSWSWHQPLTYFSSRWDISGPFLSLNFVK